MDFIFIRYMWDPGEPSEVFIILPCYNEHNSIIPVVTELIQYGYTVVLVDDGSIPPIESLVRDKSIFYLRHKINLGQGAALQTGISYALKKSARFIVTFDADGQHRASEIQGMLQFLSESRLDIVLGSRFLLHSNLHMDLSRKLVLQVARFANFLLTGYLLSDAHNGFRVMTAKAASRMQITENGMSHATEFLSEIKRNKLQYSEFPVTVDYTDYSKQKGQSSWNSFRILFDLLLNKFFR